MVRCILSHRFASGADGQMNVYSHDSQNFADGSIEDYLTNGITHVMVRLRLMIVATRQEKCLFLPSWTLPDPEAELLD